jgi:tRNA U55 pseudouridine synthase TruB
MEPMNAYLAEVLIQGRLAAAEAAREGRRFERERRVERRRRRRVVIQDWWRRRAQRRPAAVQPAMALAPGLPVRPMLVEVASVLSAAAYGVAERGTASERRLLEAMATVSAVTAAGAAAALVDWEGTEASRLRAFGLVHAHVIEVLGPREHEWLLDSLDGDADLEVDGRVA